jgi:uncharacterized protein YciI
MRRPADAGRRSPTFDVLIGAVRPAILADRQARHRGRKGEGAMTEARIRELTKSMLRKKLYVVLSKGGAAPEKIAEHLPRHLEYMIGLEKKGVLFASGPLAEADGKTRGDGLTILRAASAKAAREIAEADPFVVHGLRSFELREWTVMEGSLGIKVNFSDQSLELA